MRDIIKNIIYIARRFKLATCFNLLGLIIALGTCYLLLTQIHYHTTYNRDIKDIEKLYRMESDWMFDEWEFSDQVCVPFAKVLDSLPEVESFSLFYNPSPLLFIKMDSALQRSLPEAPKFSLAYKKDTLLIRADSIVKAPFSKVEHNYSMCSDKAISTLTQWVTDSVELNDSSATGYIIPQTIAQELFGTTDAVGKRLLYVTDDSGDSVSVMPLTVCGVYEDFPVNSELQNCIYGPLDNLNDFTFAYKCIIKFKSAPSSKDIKAFTAKLKQAIVDTVGGNAIKYCSMPIDTSVIQDRVSKTRIKLTPLRYSYFEQSTYTSGEKGYLSLLVISELACLLVLIIAAINFLNFTLAESPMRIRSVNTRRVLGASRRSLRLGMVSECVLTSVFTCLIALALCHLLSLAPDINKLFVGSIMLKDHMILAVAMPVLAAIVGLVSGFYPSAFATSFPPAMVLNGNFGLTSQGRRLRSALVCIQLTISMLMVMYTGILFMQKHFIDATSYGYDKDRILTTTVPEQTDRDSLRLALEELPGIERVSFSNNLMGSGDAHDSQWIESEGHVIRQHTITADPQFLSTLGIQIIEGRDFNVGDTTAIIINEAARKQWYWIDLEQQQVSIGSGEHVLDSAKVIGVCGKIRYGTTRISNEMPFGIIIKNSDYLADYMSSVLSVRLAPGASSQDVMRAANKLVRKYSRDKNELKEFSKVLSKAYKIEYRYFDQLTSISLICLIITLIGVFCLTMFETEHRRKEIGIRKVVGATPGEIVGMLCQQYIPLILISFVIAAPLALLFGWMSLKHFAERTEIHWWIFPLALLIVGGMTMTTILLQSWRTARENPVNSIKTE